MKKIFFLFLPFIIASCTESNSGQKDMVDSTNKINSEPIENLPGSVENNFLLFAKAIQTSDKKTIKTFIDFPILNENNEIWYLVSDGTDNTPNTESDKIKPFPEETFDKYYDKIFTTAFANCLEKINVDTLFIKGEFETIELQDEDSSYKIYASIDKSTNTLTLNLAYTTPIFVNGEDENEFEEKQESNVIYYFKISENSHLKFIQIRTAG